MKRVAIIGAGHNGLVAACYLARAGFDVSIFEQRKIVGGLCATEELFPGIRASVLASWYGMFRREIIDDLALEDFGLAAYRTPYISTHFPDGDAILYRENVRNGDAMRFFIPGITEKDIAQWRHFWNHIGTASRILSDNLLTEDFTRADYSQKLEDAGLADLAKRVFSVSAVDYCEEWLANGTLASAAANMNFDHPCSSGSLFEIILLGTANAFGTVGQWGFAKGGLGALPSALSKVALRNGVKIATDTAVAAIDERRITLANGEEHTFDILLSSTDPLTHKKLTSEKSATSEYKIFSSKAIVHLELSSLPRFEVFDNIGRSGDDRYKGSIDLRVSLDQLRAGYEMIKAQKFPADNTVISSHLPTACDETISSGGQKHLWSFFHHAVPVSDEGQPWAEKGRAEILAATIAIARKIAPDLEGLVKDVIIITPTDLQKTFGLATASCSHLPMTQDYLFEGRLDYRTDAENIYLCGAGTRANGTVTGLGGYHAAHIIMREYKP